MISRILNRTQLTHRTGDEIKRINEAKFPKVDNEEEPKEDEK